MSTRAAVLSVLSASLAAVLVLPAMLMLLGDRIDAHDLTSRLRGGHGRHRREKAPIWGRLAAATMKPQMVPSTTIGTPTLETTESSRMAEPSGPGMLVYSSLRAGRPVAHS